MDMLMLCMPGHTIRWPSLALGIIHRVLAEQGFCSGLWYANLRFAQALGLEAAIKAENKWSTEFLFDWLFQAALFPDHALSVEDYIRDYLGAGRLSADAHDELCRQREAWRSASEAFLYTLCRDIVQVNPVAVGFSLGVTQLFSSLALMRLLRQAAPHLVIIAGGPCCETVGAEDLHRTFPGLIDFAVSGDAETVIGPLLHWVLRKGRSIDVGDIPYGVIAPVHRIIGYPADPGFPDGAPRAGVFNLDALPEPDHTPYYNTLDTMFEISRFMSRVGVFESSRGCGRGEKSLCNFCGDCGALPAYRKKSPDRVWDELSRIQNQFGVQKFVATDNMIPPEFFKTLLPRLAALPKKLSLFYEIRPTIGKHQARRLKQAGVNFVQAGIESLNTSALKAMNKGVTVCQNIQCLKWCRQYGIEISWYIITRIPGEQDEWNQDQCSLIPILVHLPPPRFTGIIRPDRHSHFFQNAEHFGMNVQIKPGYSRLFGVPLTEHARFVFHLEDVGVARQMQDQMDFAFRPGLHCLKNAAERWRAVYLKRRPRLDMRRVDGGLRITDTRFSPTPVHHRISGLAARLLSFCDTAPTRTRMDTWFASRQVTPDVARQLIDELENNKLIVNMENRIISLVLNYPCIEPPAEQDLPVGWIEGE